MERFRSTRRRTAAVVSGLAVLAVGVGGCAATREDSAGASSPVAAVAVPAQDDGDGFLRGDCNIEVAAGTGFAGRR